MDGQIVALKNSNNILPKNFQSARGIFLNRLIDFCKSLSLAGVVPRELLALCPCPRPVLACECAEAMSFSTFGARNRKGIWCGRRESNPHRPLSPADFHAVYGFRRPDAGAFRALTPGLRSGLSLHPPPDDPGLRCRPSSLYTFPAEVFRPGLARDCHSQVSPNLGSSASPVSQASTQVFLKSAASAIPPRPRGWSSAATIIAGRENLHVSVWGR